MQTKNVNNIKKILSISLILLAFLPQITFGNLTGMRQEGNATFGNYNPFSSTPIDNVGVTLHVYLIGDKPPGTITYTITLSAGSSGDFLNRKMTGPSSSTLNYNLYLDTYGGIIWGNGVGHVITKTSDKCTNNPDTTPCLHTVYARLFAGQTSAPVGTYTDTITATLTY